MKNKKLVIILSLFTIAMLFVGTLPVMAAKPSQVITASNGFPSGMHFNLNIHGKNPENFTTPGPPPYDPPYGNSIFIPEYTEPYSPITIECISDKKSIGTELEVIDPYAMPSLYANGDPTGFTYADDLAQFNLPYKIQTDDGVVNANGYYVYGRILGKPNNSAKKDGDPSSIIVSPNPILQLADSDGVTFPLGLMTAQGSYELADQEFIRFDDSSSTNGKGKSLAKNITDMFMWTGWVVDGSLDSNGDGIIDENDIPADAFLTNPEWDTDGSGDISLDEWLTAMADLSLARYYEDWWVFDIAEMVTQSWGIENDGTKLLQIRFYPVATTTFTEKAHIVVKKVTDPADDTSTLFDFDADYRNPWQMTSNQFCLSQGLDAGSYEVTELAEEGWDLAGIQIEDPTGGSSYSGNTAYIDLAEGETVTVTFTNTQRSQITVVKEYIPEDAPSTQFDYTGDLGAFYLTGNGASYDSGWLLPNTIYDVTEAAPPAGWELTGISIDDPTADSSYDLGTATASIYVSPGENIVVTFTNTYTAP